MNTSRLWRMLASLSILSALAAACGGAAAPSASPATVSAPKVTASGFECPAPEPRAEVASQEINLFVWTEYIPQDILDCFSLVYDVQVNREEFSSNEELYAKLSAGASGYDIIHPSDYIIRVMMRQNMLAKLDKSRLSNLQNIGADFLTLYGDRADYVVPYQVGTQAIVYNADQVATPPNAWADLWNPEYADHMVFVDDPRVIIGLTLLSLGYDVNTQDAAQLAEAEVKLKELVANVKLFDSDSPKTPLIAGDADLGVVWNGEAFLAQREMASMQYVFPTEGVITFEDGFAIPANAPHADAAYAWMNYALQANVAWLLLQDYPYTLPNVAALEYARTAHPEVYEPYINSNITNTPVAELLKGHQVEDVGEATVLYDRLWTEVKGGQ